MGRMELNPGGGVTCASSAQVPSAQPGFNLNQQSSKLWRSSGEKEESEGWTLIRTSTHRY